MVNKKTTNKSQWGGRRERSGAKGREGGTAKICVSVTETILQNALKKWQGTRSRLVDHLLRGFVAKRQRYEYNT
jgi:hypothetical protein